MDKLDRAKLLTAASYLSRTEASIVEQRVLARLNTLESRELFITLVPLFEQSGLRLIEDEDELCLEYNGKVYPLRGPEGKPGIKGSKGDKGDTGNSGVGLTGEGITEEQKNLIDEAVAAAQQLKIKVPKKIPKTPGNLVTGNENDDEKKYREDMDLYVQKQEFMQLRQDISTDINSRMNKLAMLMGGGGGGGGEVKFSRLDDVNMAGWENGGVLYYDVNEGKIKPAERVLIGGTGDILKLDTFALMNQNVEPVAGVMTIDYLDGNFATVMLSDNVTSFNITNWPTSDITVGKLTMIIKQTNGGNHTMTWPPNTVWPEGSPPVITPTEGTIDIIILTTTDMGTTIIGNMVGQNYS